MPILINNAKLISYHPLAALPPGSGGTLTSGCRISGMPLLILMPYAATPIPPVVFGH